MPRRCSARPGTRREFSTLMPRGSDLPELAARVAGFAPDMLVVTTAPSYLFWRCAPPELRVPQLTLRGARRHRRNDRRGRPARLTTPRATLRKLGVDAVVIGECEEVLVRLAEMPRRRWGEIAGLCRRDGGDIVVQGGPQAADMARLPALRWPAETLRRHRASSSPLRPPAVRPRRRNGGVARLPLSLHLLRQGEFPRPLPPPPARRRFSTSSTG